MEMHQLSRRQNEVLRLVALGYTNRRIGLVLGIARQTVKSHLTAIYELLGVRGRTQAAVAWVIEEMKERR